MSNTLYDAEILQTYADDLYRQAQWIVLNTAAHYAIIGFLLFAVIGFGTKTQVPDLDPLVAGAAGAFIAAIVGGFIGQSKVFNLKLEAQKILCQRQIELNTRSTDQAQAASASS